MCWLFDLLLFIWWLDQSSYFISLNVVGTNLELRSNQISQSLVDVRNEPMILVG